MASMTSPLQLSSAFAHDPNVIFLLFVAAMLGLCLEIAHPGGIIPGVIGTIFLLLFIVAVDTITPNWNGMLLMVLAFLLLVADVHLPAYGMLTAGSVVALIVGTLIFFNSGDATSRTQINPILVYIVGGLIGLIGFGLVTYMMRVRQMRVTTGTEGMLGKSAFVVSSLHPYGRVNYGGENWSAVLDDPSTILESGRMVQIVAVEGLKLRVRPSGNGQFTDASDPFEVTKEN